jgi:signal transduction histidine kinase
VIRFRSVVSRIVALHLLAILGTSICMPVALYLMLHHAAEELHNRALQSQAGDILRHIHQGPGGGLSVTLPPQAEELYSEGYGRYSYAVLDAEGRVLASSFADNRALLRSAPQSQPQHYFTQRRDGAEIFGVSIKADVGGRPVLVQVAQDLAHRDVLIDDIVAQFFVRVGWVTAPILLLLLIIDVIIFRRAIRPVIAASRLAERIGPARTELRLPEEKMPEEVLPLVQAVNRALDRLEAGFRGQREFTADAAHELRTPLAILRTQVDTIDDRELAESLRNDVENMSRLVNQLLEISELDSFVVGADEIADLGAIAAEVAAFIAPLALSRQRTVEVSGAPDPVLVRGNGDALARAVRNLVENALAHTPPGTSVEIEVDPAGALRVMDHGPGVPIAVRDQIFRRFWRGDRRRSGSAGLGLSIVARTAEMHEATVSVGDRPGGGAVFTIRFPHVCPSRPAAAARTFETVP